MMSGYPSIDLMRVKAVVEDCFSRERFDRIPLSEHDLIPDFLRVPKRTSFSYVVNDQFFLLNFTDEHEQKRIAELRRKGLFPYPGLIVPDNVDMGAAFHFENSNNVLLESCTINNMFSLSVGKNSTIILRNHNQLIKTNELKSYSYTLKLAYIISFGDKINYENFYQVLHDLLLYSMKQWGITLA